jgi:hypothetical protein
MTMKSSLLGYNALQSGRIPPTFGGAFAFIFRVETQAKQEVGGKDSRWFVVSFTLRLQQMKVIDCFEMSVDLCRIARGVTPQNMVLFACYWYAFDTATLRWALPVG